MNLLQFLWLNSKFPGFPDKIIYLNSASSSASLYASRHDQLLNLRRSFSSKYFFMLQGLREKFLKKLANPRTILHLSPTVPYKVACSSLCETLFKQVRMYATEYGNLYDPFSSNLTQHSGKSPTFLTQILLKAALLSFISLTVVFMTFSG